MKSEKQRERRVKEKAPAESTGMTLQGHNPEPLAVVIARIAVYYTAFPAERKAMKRKNILEATADVEIPEEFDMTVGDMQTIYKLFYEYHRCPYTLISTAFEFGYVQGQAAAESKAREERQRR